MYKEIIRPVLDHLDSEFAHTTARELLAYASSVPFVLERFNDQGRRFSDERLHTSAGGISFENPVTVGAGWDKVGRSVLGLHTLGFSAVEVGSVLLDPQPGNPKPRQFMLTSGVALNHLGFNSPGAEVVAKNLQRYSGMNIPIGISIGKNKEVHDIQAAGVYGEVAQRLRDYADYFAVNVSSPNTPGLRRLQDAGFLTDIIQSVQANARKKNGESVPVLIKIAPDLEITAIDDVIRVVQDERAAGIIATNTTNNPDIRGRYGERWRNQVGGLSGDDPLFRAMSTKVIAHVYRQTAGSIDIIGVGGIHNAETAWEKITAGARVVQIVTALRSEGPAVAGKINRGLMRIMEAEGVKSIQEIVGTAAW